MQPHEYVVMEIARERERQISVKGWTSEHDDAHTKGEIADAAAAYAVRAGGRDAVFAGLGRAPLLAQVNCGWVHLSSLLWPWSREWWKPSDPRRDLIKAAALIVAELRNAGLIRLGERFFTGGNRKPVWVKA